ncbi:MAG: GNAT family N-acetyltransferase [Alphaproteobacteria bacterium]|nr:GNAT family N-acetyltransferase [Alphaproteobacteria bacterium]
MKTRTGRNVQFRRIWPGETALLTDHLKLLSPADRRFRFAREVDDAFIESYCARIDWLTDIVIGAFSGEELVGSGVFNLIGWTLPLTAGAAVAVDADLQGEGIGSELLRRLLVVSQNRLVRRLYLLCLNDNVAMRRMAQRFGGRIDTFRDETESLFEPSLPTPLSFAVEAMDASEHLAFWAGMPASALIQPRSRAA